MLALFATYGWRGMRSAFKATDEFGRFAALLVSMSILLALAGLMIGGATLSPAGRLVTEWSGAHFMIATHASESGATARRARTTRRGGRHSAGKNRGILPRK